MSYPLGKLYFTQKQLISHTKKIFSDKVQIPKWAPFAPNGTANQIAGNPGTTMVSIGHLTTWPENPGYRTQVWDNIHVLHSACMFLFFFSITSKTGGEHSHHAYTVEKVSIEKYMYSFICLSWNSMWKKCLDEDLFPKKMNIIQC